MPLRRTWLVRLVLAVPILLVLIPLEGPRQVSMWHLAAAREKQDRDDVVGARQSLEKAVAWNSANARAWLALAEVDRAQGDWVSALSHCDRAIELDPENLQYLLTRSSVNQLAGRHQQAVDDARQYVAIGEQKLKKVRDTAARVGLISDMANTTAYARAVAGLELDEALKDANTAVLLRGGKAKMIAQFGYLKYLRRQHGEALELLSRAIQLLERELETDRKPDRAKALNGLAELEDQLAQFHVYRALVYEETNQPDAAATDWAKVRALGGDEKLRDTCPHYLVTLQDVVQNGTVLDTLGYVLLQRGDALALSTLDLAVQQVETLLDDWDTRYHYVSPQQLRALERRAKESVAAVRYHRSLAYDHQGLPSKAELDRQRVRELGFVPDANLH